MKASLRALHTSALVSDAGWIAAGRGNELELWRSEEEEAVWVGGVVADGLTIHALGLKLEEDGGKGGSWSVCVAVGAEERVFVGRIKGCGGEVDVSGEGWEMKEGRVVGIELLSDGVSGGGLGARVLLTDRTIYTLSKDAPIKTKLGGSGLLCCGTFHNNHVLAGSVGGEVRMEEVKEKIWDDGGGEGGGLKAPPPIPPPTSSLSSSSSTSSGVLGCVYVVNGGKDGRVYCGGDEWAVVALRKVEEDVEEGEEELEVVWKGYGHSARVWSISEVEYHVKEWSDAGGGESGIESSSTPTTSSPITLVVSGAEDATARVWRADTGMCLCVLRGHSRRHVRFTMPYAAPNSILTAGADGRVHVWNLQHYLPSLTVDRGDDEDDKEARTRAEAVFSSLPTITLTDPARIVEEEKIEEVRKDEGGGGEEVEEMVEAEGMKKEKGKGKEEGVGGGKEEESVEGEEEKKKRKKRKKKSAKKRKQARTREEEAEKKRVGTVLVFSIAPNSDALWLVLKSGWIVRVARDMSEVLEVGYLGDEVLAADVLWTGDERGVVIGGTKRGTILSASFSTTSTSSTPTSFTLYPSFIPPTPPRATNYIRFLPTLPFSTPSTHTFAFHTHNSPHLLLLSLSTAPARPPTPIASLSFPSIHTPTSTWKRLYGACFLPSVNIFVGVFVKGALGMWDLGGEELLRGVDDGEMVEIGCMGCSYPCCERGSSLLSISDTSTPHHTSFSLCFGSEARATKITLLPTLPHSPRIVNFENSVATEALLPPCAPSCAWLLHKDHPWEAPTSVLATSFLDREWAVGLEHWGVCVWKVDSIGPPIPILSYPAPWKAPHFSLSLPYTTTPTPHSISSSQITPLSTSTSPQPLAALLWHSTLSLFTPPPKPPLSLTLSAGPCHGTVGTGAAATVLKDDSGLGGSGEEGMDDGDGEVKIVATAAEDLRVLLRTLPTHHHPPSYLHLVSSNSPFRTLSFTPASPLLPPRTTFLVGGAGRGLVVVWRIEHHSSSLSAILLYEKLLFTSTSDSERINGVATWLRKGDGEGERGGDGEIVVVSGSSSGVLSLSKFPLHPTAPPLPTKASSPPSSPTPAPTYNISGAVLCMSSFVLDEDGQVVVVAVGDSTGGISVWQVVGDEMNMLGKWNMHESGVNDIHISKAKHDALTLCVVGAGDDERLSVLYLTTPSIPLPPSPTTHGCTFPCIAAASAKGVWSCDADWGYVVGADCFIRRFTLPSIASTPTPPSPPSKPPPIPTADVMRDPPIPIEVNDPEGVDVVDDTTIIVQGYGTQVVFL